MWQLEPPKRGKMKLRHMPSILRRYAWPTVIVAVAAVAIILLVPATTTLTYVRAAPDPVSLLSNAQRVWLYTLEWNESRGNPKAINPKDRDNTPSYGCFQFKPDTLALFGKLYGLPHDTLMDCQEQTEIVAEMILHRDQIDWHQQFPWSVKKIGLPPK